MSAAQPKSSEPSMEEILASIRRIIADEPAKAAPPPAAANVPQNPPAAVPQVAPAEDDEVMDLKPKVKAKEPHYIADDPVDNDVSFAEMAPAPVPRSQDDIDALMAAAAAEEEPMAPPAPQPSADVLEPSAQPAVTLPPLAMQSPPADRLISADADRAATAAFGSLTNTILSKNARTLDDLMQEMMRPMVKQWLDDNLPTVVERLVRAEIERVARGGR
jgi:uncharacterized protein